MLLGFNEPIWFYQQPIDFRKQLDGLIILTAAKLDTDPTSGQLFIFRNKKADRLKFLWWDKHGFWLFYKRLEKGKFFMPKIADSKLELSKEQLSLLLAGLDFINQKYLKKVTAKNFY
jgi:transposase